MHLDESFEMDCRGLGKTCGCGSSIMAGQSDEYAEQRVLQLCRDHAHSQLSLTASHVEQSDRTKETAGGGGSGCLDSLIHLILDQFSSLPKTVGIWPYMHPGL